MRRRKCVDAQLRIAGDARRAREVALENADAVPALGVELRDPLPELRVQLRDTVRRVLVEVPDPALQFVADLPDPGLQLPVEIRDPRIQSLLELSDAAAQLAVEIGDPRRRCVDPSGDQGAHILGMDALAGDRLREAAQVSKRPRQARQCAQPGEQTAQDRDPEEPLREVFPAQPPDRDGARPPFAAVAQPAEEPGLGVARQQCAKELLVLGGRRRTPEQRQVGVVDEPAVIEARELVDGGGGGCGAAGALPGTVLSTIRRSDHGGFRCPSSRRPGGPDPRIVMAGIGRRDSAARSGRRRRFPALEPGSCGVPCGAACDSTPGPAAAIARWPRSCRYTIS